MGEPATPAEAAALDTFRQLLPDDGITTAWANLTFINDHGRTAEVDVLLLTTQGMYLVELKGWHGTIRGNAQRWNQGQRNVENPRLAADRRAKWLKSLSRTGRPTKPREGWCRASTPSSSCTGRAALSRLNLQVTSEC